MRLILPILVLCNLTTFAWFSHQESTSEPAPREVHAVPEGINTLRLLSEQSSIKDVSVSGKNQPEIVSICHTFGPIERHELALDVLAEIEGLGRAGSIRGDKHKVQYAYWVYLEAIPPERLNSVIQALEADGIKDYHRNDRNQLSLGIYKGMIHAKRRQLNIAALGFSPLMGPLYRTEKIYWVDVTDMHFRFHTDDAWESYVARYPDSQHESTRCDLINASHQRTIDPMTPIT